MWIRVGSAYSRVERASEEEQRWFTDYLAANTGESFRPKIDERGKPIKGTLEKVDTAIKLFDQRTLEFPSGCLAPIVRRARFEGYEVHLIDDRVHPLPDKHPARTLRGNTAAISSWLKLDERLAWLRPYQIEAIAAALNKERGILKLSTGAGKGEIAVALTIAAPVRWLFLVHRDVLVEDIAERYVKRTGKFASRLRDDGTGVFVGERDDGSLTVATFQSVYAGIKRRDPRILRVLEAAQGVIVDEAHTAAADTFWSVLMSIPSARYVVGLSGSPLSRTDKKDVLTVAAIGPIIYELKSDELIERGVLAKPRIKMIEVVQRDDPGTWAETYDKLIVNSAARNAAIVHAVKKSEKPCLVYVKTVEHGKGLAYALNNAGVRARFVYGNDDTAERKAAIDAVARGELDALVCSVIFQEGVDIPSLRTVVIAAGGKSIIASVQRIGRGMRRAEGKDEFTVYDVLDRGNETLVKHARARMRAYMSEGHEVMVDNVTGQLALPTGGGRR